MRILITGATNGMGLGVARVLAEQGHELVIHGRSSERCTAIAEELSGLGSPDVTLAVADFTDLDQVRAAAREVISHFHHLDAVFVNAGIGYAKEQVQTANGFDSHFQVNYLAHFLLVLQLLPLLEASEHLGRVVFNATNYGELDFDDLQMEKDWGYERGVTQNMVAKRMFFLELHERYQARTDVDVAFFGFHIHKAVWTNQLQIIPTMMRLMAGAMKLFGQFYSMEQCGRIMAPLFTDGPEATSARSGRLLTWEDEAFTTIEHTPEVLDAANRQRLWDLSLELCRSGTTRTASERIAAPRADPG